MAKSRQEGDAGMLDNIDNKKVLVTGGAGYIGSHACFELIKAGYEVIVLDNFSNSSSASIGIVEKLTGKRIPFVNGDVRNQKDLQNVFAEYEVNAVLHFAGLKSVGESVVHPLSYFDNNFNGTLNLCKVMADFDCKVLAFSSSATVYGKPDEVPVNENFPLSATNPYARSKLMVEDMLRDLFSSDKDWSIGLLRYFNPIGAHESGLIGENPNGTPNNLMPFISQVAAGKIDKLRIFGGDYLTPDGSGVRDYIHVIDLAKGHVKALDKLLRKPDLVAVNFGTGRGYSVLEMVRAFEKSSGCRVPYEIVARRPGDVAICYADPNFAWECLGWRAEHGIDRMCEDTWRWQLKNPHGYETN